MSHQDPGLEAQFPARRREERGCRPVTGKDRASGSWEIDGETVETVSDFIFLGSKITADGDCSHEIKRRLLLGRKVTLEKTLMLGGIGGKRRRGQQRMRWLDDITNGDRAVSSVLRPLLLIPGSCLQTSKVRLYFSGLQDHCRW